MTYVCDRYFPSASEALKALATRASRLRRGDYLPDLEARIARASNPPAPTAVRHGNPKYVLARGGVLPNVTQVAVAVFPGLIETELHSHPTMHEVYFVLEGEAVYTIGKDRYEVSPGDFFVVPPGVIHNQKVTAPPHRCLLLGNRCR
jgi:quercetin dioxygenase-like cupin family protein